jgi:membrane protein implicated in regulation of membrane protease activity
MAFTSAGLAWLIIGVICFLLEMVLPGFIIFFFGLGAWVVALVSWLMPIGLNVQLVIFLLASLVALFAFRGLIRKTFFGDSIIDKKGTMTTIGGRAEVVIEIVPPSEGRILYSGTHWRAIADERIEKGSIVEILSQDDLCMKVGRVVK